MAKNPPTNASRCKRHGFDPWVRKIFLRGEHGNTLQYSSGQFHGQRCLAIYSSWVAELDMTEVTKHAPKTAKNNSPQNPGVGSKAVISAEVKRRLDWRYFDHRTKRTHFLSAS